MSIVNDTTEQLLALRALTRATGVLHEAQILQMKLWPFVLFPKHKVKYELSIDQDAKRVIYSMLLPETPKPPKDSQKALKGLEEVLQWLLGTEWLLEVQVDVAVKGKAPRPLVDFKGARRVKALEAAESKSYNPFIRCVEKYVGTKTEVPEPPQGWSHK